MSPEYRDAQDNVKEATSFGMSLIREYTDAKLRLAKSKSASDKAEAETAMKFAMQSMANLRTKYSADRSAEAQKYVADKNAEGRGEKDTRSDFQKDFDDAKSLKEGSSDLYKELGGTDKSALDYIRGKEPKEKEEKDLLTQATDLQATHYAQTGQEMSIQEAYSLVKRGVPGEDEDEDPIQVFDDALKRAEEVSNDKGWSIDKALYYITGREHDETKDPDLSQMNLAREIAVEAYGEGSDKKLKLWWPLYEAIKSSGRSRSGSGSGESSGAPGIFDVPTGDGGRDLERTDKIPKLLRPSARAGYWETDDIRGAVAPVFASPSVLRSLKDANPGLVVDFMASISLSSDKESDLAELWNKGDFGGFGEKLREYGVLGDFYNESLSYDSLLGLVLPSKDFAGKPAASPIDGHLLSLDPGSKEFDKLSKVKSDLLEAIEITKKDINQGIPTSDLVYPVSFASHLNDKYENDPTALHQAKTNFLLDKMSLSTMNSVFMRQYEHFDKEREIKFLRGEVSRIFGNPNIPDEDKIHMSANALRNWIAGSWSTAGRAYQQSASRNELLMDMMELRLIIQKIQDTGGVGTGPLSGLVNWVQRNAGLGTPNKLATHFQSVLRDAKVNYIRSEFGLSKEDAEDRLIQGIEDDFFPKFREQEGYISDKLDSAIDETMGNLNEQFIAQMGTDLFNLSDDYKGKHRDRIRAELVKSGVLDDKEEEEETEVGVEEVEETEVVDVQEEAEVFGPEIPSESAVGVKSQYYKSISGYKYRDAALSEASLSASSDEDAEILSRVRQMLEFEDAFIDYLNENSISLTDGVNNADFIRRLQETHSLLPSEVKIVMDSILESYSDEESQ